MKLAIMTVVVHSVSPVQAHAQSYDLPIEVTCKDKTIQSTGAVICPSGASSTKERSLKVKIPPTRGQLRVLDCETELTGDGNPDDFNHMIEKTGWFLWRKAVRVLSETPSFQLPLKNYADCPIVVSVAGENAGVHVAAIVYEPRPRQDFLSFKCGGVSATTKGGVGVCRGFEGSQVTITTEKEGTLYAIGSACGISLSGSDGSVSFPMPEGLCILDMGMGHREGKLKSRLILLGRDRSARRLDNPVMVRDGGNRRIFKPQGAKIVSTEIYHQGEIVWRSGIRDQDSYKIDPSKDNGDKYKSSNRWPNGATACHTAYTDEFDSMSGSCYDLNSLKELPYFFR